MPTPETLTAVQDFLLIWAVLSGVPILLMLVVFSLLEAIKNPHARPRG